MTLLRSLLGAPVEHPSDIFWNGGWWYRSCCKPTLGLHTYATREYIEDIVFLVFDFLPPMNTAHYRPQCFGADR